MRLEVWNLRAITFSGRAYVRPSSTKCERFRKSGKLQLTKVRTLSIAIWVVRFRTEGYKIRIAPSCPNVSIIFENIFLKGLNLEKMSITKSVLLN